MKFVGYEYELEYDITVKVKVRAFDDWEALDKADRVIANLEGNDVAITHYGETVYGRGNSLYTD